MKTQGILNKWNVAFVLIIALVISSCTKENHEMIILQDQKVEAALEVKKIEKKKVLYINSYSLNFEWVQDITKGMFQVLNVSIDEKTGLINDEESSIDFKMVHMYTLKNKSMDYIQNVTEKMRTIIDTWKPDLIITSDDNAAKFVIAPFYSESSIPVLFCGINWDASEYGFPTDNVTGMIEVTLLPELLKILRAHADGDRVGFIAADNISERKNAQNYIMEFGVALKEVYAVDLEDFKTKFLALQKEVDMIVLGNIQSLESFSIREAASWLAVNTKIPTGAQDKFLAPYVVVTCAKSGAEQGRWVAHNALQVLNGKNISQIPITRNKENQIYLNLGLGYKVGMIFSQELESKAVRFNSL